MTLPVLGIFAFALWAVLSPTAVSCTTAFLAIVLAVSVLVCRLKSDNVIAGFVAGGSAVSAFVIVRWIILVGDYYLARRHSDYYEDGVAMELVIAPIVYFVTYVPVGAVLGSVIGATFWSMRELGTRPARAERPHPAGANGT